MSPKDWPKFVLDAIGDPSSKPKRAREVLQSVRVDESSSEMTLIGIDEWTTFFTLRWFFTTDLVSDEVDGRLQAGLVWDITDDLGNKYVGGDYGSGGGNSTHWTFTSQFAPAIHAGASLLSVGVSSPMTGHRLTAAVPL